MKRILNWAVPFALLLTLATDVSTLVVSTDGENEPVYSTGLIWDSWEIIESNLREEPRLRSKLPPTADLKDVFPVPGNQGQQGSCVPWALTYALRSHQEEVKRNWGLDTDEHLFSPSYVYNQINNGKDEGSSIYEAINILVRQGVCTLASWPYDETDYTTRPTSEQQDEAALYKVSDWYAISGIDNIKRRLADGDGVVVLFNIYPDFSSISSSNPIFDDMSGESIGGHAVCLIGYDDTKAAFQFINSWDKGWGLDGYGWISYDLMKDSRINQYGVAVGFVLGEPIVHQNPYTYTVSKGEAKITHYYGDGGEIVIPETLDGYTVTGIEYGAFQNCKSLVSVVIPDSVLTIGDSAFSGCTSLTGIVLGGGVTSIGKSAFQGCTSLTGIDIPQKVTEINNSTFYGCTKLMNIIIGNGVTVIGDSAFYGCTGLSSIIIGNGVKKIGISAFEKCSSLNEIIIPGSVAEIGSSAFYSCTKLTKVIIGNGVKEIGRQAFRHCKSLISIELPESITTIANHTFADCTELREVNFKGNVTDIGNYTFQNCKSLTSVPIPESVSIIGNYTFSGCTGLTDMVIPENVTEIGRYAFFDCTRLNRVIISNNVERIEDYAFKNCTSLTDITIPDNVTSIGYGSFSDCKSLTNFIVSEANPEYASMDGVLFDKSLSTLIAYPTGRTGEYVIPDNVITIGFESFVNCTRVTKITIPDSVVTIDSQAFSGCTGLNGITIGNSVIKISNNAFRNCTGLTSVVIPESVIEIDSFAFDDCTKLNSVIIMKGATKIGMAAFQSCKELTNITIPSSVTFIDSYVFRFIGANLTIHCEEGSYAHEYAIANDIQFSIIPNAETIKIEVFPIPNTDNITVNHIELTTEGDGFYNLKADFEKPEEALFILAIYEGELLSKTYFADENAEIKDISESDLAKGKIYIWDKNMQPCIEVVKLSNNKIFR